MLGGLELQLLDDLVSLGSSVVEDVHLSALLILGLLLDCSEVVVSEIVGRPVRMTSLELA